MTARYTQGRFSATKTGQPILLTPQSVQIVTRQVLLDQNAITLTDAVRNVAGVSSDFGFGGATVTIVGAARVLHGLDDDAKLALQQRHLLS